MYHLSYRILSSLTISFPSENLFHYIVLCSPLLCLYRNSYHYIRSSGNVPATKAAEWKKQKKTDPDPCSEAMNKFKKVLAASHAAAVDEFVGSQGTEQDSKPQTDVPKATRSTNIVSIPASPFRGPKTPLDPFLMKVLKKALIRIDLFNDLICDPIAHL